MIELAKLIKECVEQVGDEDAVSFYPNYSGRSMYGSECVGIVGGETECMSVIAEVVKQLHDHTGEGLDFPMAVDTLMLFSRDSMGRSDVIIYWPTIAPIQEDQSDEDDGQPSELDEWMDFNPDC